MGNHGSESNVPTTGQANPTNIDQGSSESVANTHKNYVVEIHART